MPPESAAKVTVGLDVDDFLKKFRRLDKALREFSASRIRILMNGKPHGWLSGKQVLRAILPRACK